MQKRNKSLTVNISSCTNIYCLSLCILKALLLKGFPWDTSKVPFNATSLPLSQYVVGSTAHLWFTNLTSHPSTEEEPGHIWGSSIHRTWQWELYFFSLYPPDDRHAGSGLWNVAAPRKPDREKDLSRTMWTGSPWLTGVHNGPFVRIPAGTPRCFIHDANSLGPGRASCTFGSGIARIHRPPASKAAPKFPISSSLVTFSSYNNALLFL